MRISTLLVSTAATAFAVWMFLFTSELRAQPLPAHQVVAAVVSR